MQTPKKQRRTARKKKQTKSERVRRNRMYAVIAAYNRYRNALCGCIRIINTKCNVQWYILQWLDGALVGGRNMSMKCWWFSMHSLKLHGQPHKSTAINWPNFIFIIQPNSQQRICLIAQDRGFQWRSIVASAFHFKATSESDWRIGFPLNRAFRFAVINIVFFAPSLWTVFAVNINPVECLNKSKRITIIFIKANLFCCAALWNYSNGDWVFSDLESNIVAIRTLCTAL